MRRHHSVGCGKGDIHPHFLKPFDFKMKFAIFAAFALKSAVALQGGYLSQLSGAQVAAASGNPAFFPPQPSGNMMSDLYSSGPPRSRMDAADFEEGNRANGAFFPAPVASMGDLYSSAPPRANVQQGGSSTAAINGQQSKASNELVQLWSDQVSVELGASQLYLSASIWFRSKGLHGMAAFMLEESGEERGHGLAILEFAMKRGLPVTLKELDAPRNNWQSPVDVWVDILNAEQTNTQNLLRLAATADGCGEYGCMAFLDPFHVEQIEAEDKVGAILSKLQQAPELLRQIDHELGLEAEEEAGHH